MNSDFIKNFKEIEDVHILKDKRFTGSSGSVKKNRHIT